MRKIIFLFSFLLLFSGCSNSVSVTPQEVAEKYKLLRPIRAGTVFYTCAMGRSPLNGTAVDFHLEHFGLTNTPGQKDTESGHQARKLVKKQYKETDDNIVFGLSPKGITKLNDMVEIVPSIYYFSFPLWFLPLQGELLS